jgi:thiamine transport system permease protein
MKGTPSLRGAVLLILLISLFLPLGVILSQALFEKGVLSLNPLKGVLSNPYYGRLLFFTLLQAFLSALFSLIPALAVAALFVHYDFPLKKFLLSLTTLSFILPPILVVLSFIIFWGNSGTVNTFFINLFHLSTPPLKVLYSFKAIILAHIFYNIPLALRYIYAQWSTLPRDQYEAAATQGTSKTALFFRIILPQIKSSLASSFLIIFLYCFMSFAIILVLGGGPKYSTLEVEVYRLMKFNMDFSRGGALALGETVISIVILMAYLKIEKKDHPGVLGRGEPLRTIPVKGMGVFLLITYLLTAAIFFGGPLLSLIGKSFQERISRSRSGGFTLQWYIQLFSLSGQRGSLVSLRAIGNSLFYALSSSIFSLISGTAAAYLINRKKALFPVLTEILILLPMGISSIVLALGYLFLTTQFQRVELWGDLSVIMAHSFISLPFVYRAVKTTLDKLDPSLRESALIQGANEVQSLIHIELPLLKKSLINGLLFSFALSMGEVNAVLILASPDRITIPLAIYRLIGSYNFYGAAAMGTLLILISLAVFSVMNYFEE